MGGCIQVGNLHSGFDKWHSEKWLFIISLHFLFYINNALLPHRYISIFTDICVILFYLRRTRLSVLNCYWGKRVLFVINLSLIFNRFCEMFWESASFRGHMRFKIIVILLILSQIILVPSTFSMKVQIFVSVTWFNYGITSKIYLNYPKKF